MIVGADDSSDALVLHRADELYREVRLRRVYYSGFSPIPEPSVLLPIKPPPLVREHRLYQADWLLRFYGFDVGELLPKKTRISISTSIQSSRGLCETAPSSPWTSTAPRRSSCGAFPASAR